MYSAFLPITIDDGQLSTTLDPISCHLLKDLILAISPFLYHQQFFLFLYQPTNILLFLSSYCLNPALSIFIYFIRPMSLFPFVENAGNYCQYLLFPILLLPFSLKPTSARLLPTTTPWELRRRGHQWLPPCSISWSVLLRSLSAAQRMALNLINFPHFISRTL